MDLLYRRLQPFWSVLPQRIIQEDKIANMEHVSKRQLWRYLLGDRLPRLGIIASVVGILALASIAFLLGLSVGLYEFSGWLVIPLVIGLVAGTVRAGLVPTVASLWLIALWGYVFPPLIGYLTGEWSGTGRYTHPRFAGYAYTSARDELLGGLEASTEAGLFLAVVIGTGTYVTGSIVGLIAREIYSS